MQAYETDAVVKQEKHREIRGRNEGMKEVKAPRKPLIYYYMVAMIVLMLFNWLVSPSLF